MTKQPEVKVGVYVCHCGGNISDVVDVKALAGWMAEYPQVKVAREYPFMCSDPGQGLIAEDIKAGRINRVVVAACAPALHELTFRKALERAGLNPYLYEHVNIREQVSWVHKGNHAGATCKAVNLVRAGVEKVARQEPLSALRVRAERCVAVIGGGPAGLKAALSLSGRGLKVKLFEAGASLGGRLNELGRLFPHDQDAAGLVPSLVTDVSAHPDITVHCQAPVEKVEGYVGNFTVHSPGLQTKAGALVLATGSQPVAPQPGEFGYGRDARVATLPEFQALLKGMAPGQPLAWNGRPVRHLAMVHCVGSRQTEGLNPPQDDGKVNEYCSRICCTAALHAITQVQERFPNIQIYDLYRDIRAYGRGHEAIYEKAAKAGALFFRFSETGLPEFDPAGNLKVRDSLTWDREVSIPADLIILVTGVMPRPIPGLVESLKLPVGADRFLQEAHPKLRPVEMANNGIFLAGTCQAPMTLLETLSAAGAAASKASQLLAGDEILLDPFVAGVEPALCNGCGLCLDECSYSGAILMDQGKAVVNPALCKGCGACVAVCEPRALKLAGWGLDQFEAMVDALVGAP